MKDLGKNLDAAHETPRPAGDQVTFVEISTDHDGQRVDNFLLRLCKGVPKTHVYRVIRAGEVRVNKKRVAPDTRLTAGDILRVPPMRLAQVRENVVPALEFPVLFEDDDLLIIDKPAGVAVHGGSGVSFGVIEQLRQARPDARFLELVHRLDRETSGILVLAKKRAALLGVQAQFRPQGGKEVEKRYLALVRGRVANDRQHLRFPLKKLTGANGERVVVVCRSDDAQALSAHTIVDVNERLPRFTLVTATLMTGRTHQIRVHLAQLGHPIAGDERYGDFDLNRQLSREGLKRMFLHAASLRFVHPRSGQSLLIEAALPQVCKNFMEQLRGQNA